jgi:hypothetical protein
VLADGVAVLLADEIASAGEEHTCGVTASGGVECWGKSYSGQSTPPEL